MTTPAKLDELRGQLNNKFLLGRKDSLALIDALEAAIVLIQSASSLMRKSNKGDSVESHEKAEVIALGMKLDAALARLGGER